MHVPNSILTYTVWILKLIFNFFRDNSNWIFENEAHFTVTTVYTYIRTEHA